MLMKKEVIEDNENLRKEIKDLKKQLEEEKNAYNQIYNRNQKAIEYMEHFSSDEICENITGIAKIVLEILKGEDKE